MDGGRARVPFKCKCCLYHSRICIHICIIRPEFQIFLSLKHSLRIWKELDVQKAACRDNPSQLHVIKPAGSGELLEMQPITQKNDAPFPQDWWSQGRHRLCQVAKLCINIQVQILLWNVWGIAHAQFVVLMADCKKTVKSCLPGRLLLLQSYQCLWM